LRIQKRGFFYLPSHGLVVQTLFLDWCSNSYLGMLFERRWT